MSQERPAAARLSRALANYESRYQRAVQGAKRLSKEELEATAARLLILAMQERAFAGLLAEVSGNASNKTAKALGTENALLRVRSLFEDARRSQGGQSRSAQYEERRTTVRGNWEKFDKRGRGTKKVFCEKMAAAHGVDEATVRRWLKTEQ